MNVLPISRRPGRLMKRALIVDDSRAMRLIVGRALKKMGVAEILESPDGEEGLKCLRGGIPIDAVFVDWNLPFMDGLTFIRTVRANKSFDHLCIVMVTTEAETDRVEAAFAAGADEYVMKPINEELFRRKLDALGLRTS
jgi:two-component system, chemotaxis family, chemotaxis protein CheY